jgi:Fe-S oxidoreductase
MYTTCDPRLHKIVRALTIAFHQAGIDFGTLRNDEVCCGNEIRRMGDIRPFDALKEMHKRKSDNLKYN